MARLLETERLLIEAPAEVVWSTLTDFASHRTCDSYVVAWEGEAKVGSRMRLVAMADRRREFVPTVTEVIPARCLRYEQRAPGLDWAGLLKRTFKVDVFCCPKCAGRRRVLAWLTEGAVLRRILHHLQLPELPPPLAPRARTVPAGAVGLRQQCAKK
jgi:hypothetical protein